VEIYNSEQEQVEALKAWWEKNGRDTLIGLAVVLASVFGYQQWDGHRKGVAEAASIHYQKLVEMMPGDPVAASEAGQSLIANYPDSSYAVMASMALAKLAVEGGDLDAAAAHLRSAMEKSDQPEIAALARLRLARVEFAQGKLDQALATVNGGENGGAVDALRGDILLAQGKVDAARAAYTAAVAGLSETPNKRELVQTKLDDLAKQAPTTNSVETGAE